MLSFKPTFSLCTFTFIKRLLSSSSLSAIRVMSSAYLRLLVFLLATLIPVCVSSSPAFLMMYSAYKPSAKPRRDIKKQVGKIFPFAYLSSSVSPAYSPVKHWHSQFLDSPWEGKQKSESNGLVFLPKGLISVLSDSVC